MTLDIETTLKTVENAIKNKPVPIVDLIAVQTEDPYKVLVATILSARTKDETTAVAADKLFKKAPDIDGLATLSVQELEKLIYPVGFFEIKPATWPNYRLRLANLTILFPILSKN